MQHEYPWYSLCAQRQAVRNSRFSELLASALRASSSVQARKTTGHLKLNLVPVALHAALRLVRGLLVVHVHVLGINHVTGLTGSAALRTAAARLTLISGPRARCSGLLLRFVERFRHLVQRALNVFRHRAQLGYAALATFI